MVMQLTYSQCSATCTERMVPITLNAGEWSSLASVVVAVANTLRSNQRATDRETLATAPELEMNVPYGECNGPKTDGELREEEEVAVFKDMVEHHGESQDVPAQP
jgi:hypothetical protein